MMASSSDINDKRFRLVVLALASVVLVAMIIVRVVRPPVNFRGAGQTQRERMNDFVKVLRKERLEQSCENLMTGRDQYSYPGDFHGPKFAQKDLELMLCNRRSIKVLEDLKKLPRKEQEIRCKELFARSFQKHTETWFYTYDRPQHPEFPPSGGGDIGVLKLATCVAMFAAAELDLKDLLADEFIQLHRFKAEIERVEAETPPPAKWEFAPDNRFQVNVLRLVAYQEREARGEVLAKVDEECHRLGMREKEIPIVAWNARTTAFEALFGGPIDTSKGVTKYLAYDWETSVPVKRILDGQVEVVNKLRKLVFEGR